MNYLSPSNKDHEIEMTDLSGTHQSSAPKEAESALKSDSLKKSIMAKTEPLIKEGEALPAVKSESPFKAIKEFFASFPPFVAILSIKKAISDAIRSAVDNYQKKDAIREQDIKMKGIVLPSKSTVAHINSVIDDLVKEKIDSYNDRVNLLLNAAGGGNELSQKLKDMQKRLKELLTEKDYSKFTDEINEVEAGIQEIEKSTGKTGVGDQFEVFDRFIRKETQKVDVNSEEKEIKKLKDEIEWVLARIVEYVKSLSENELILSGKLKGYSVDLQEFKYNLNDKKQVDKSKVESTIKAALELINADEDNKMPKKKQDSEAKNKHEI